MKNYTLNFPTYHNTNHAFVFGRQSRGVEYFTVVVSILTIAVGVVANIMMCLTIAVSASLRTAMNTYVLSIGLVDLLTSALLLPLRVVLDRKLFYSEEIEPMLFATELFVRTFSDITRLLLMTSLSMERYQSIARPFMATKGQARRRAVIVSVVIWSIAAVLSIISVRYFCDSVLHHPCLDHSTDTLTNWGDLEAFVEMPLSFISILAIAVSYGLIFMVLRQQRKKMDSHSKPKFNQIAPSETDKKPKPLDSKVMVMDAGDTKKDPSFTIVHGVQVVNKQGTTDILPAQDVAETNVLVQERSCLNIADNQIKIEEEVDCGNTNKTLHEDDEMEMNYCERTNSQVSDRPSDERASNQVSDRPSDERTNNQVSDRPSDERTNSQISDRPTESFINNLKMFVRNNDTDIKYDNACDESAQEKVTNSVNMSYDVVTSPKTGSCGNKSHLAQTAKSSESIKESTRLASDNSNNNLYQQLSNVTNMALNSPTRNNVPLQDRPTTRTQDVSSHGTQTNLSTNSSFQINGNDFTSILAQDCNEASLQRLTTSQPHVSINTAESTRTSLVLSNDLVKPFSDSCDTKNMEDDTKELSMQSKGSAQSSSYEKISSSFRNQNARRPRDLISSLQGSSSKYAQNQILHSIPNLNSTAQFVANKITYYPDDANSHRTGSVKNRVISNKTHTTENTFDSSKTFSAKSKGSSKESPELDSRRRRSFGNKLLSEEIAQNNCKTNNRTRLSLDKDFDYENRDDILQNSHKSNEPVTTSTEKTLYLQSPSKILPEQDNPSTLSAHPDVSVSRPQLSDKESISTPKRHVQNCSTEPPLPSVLYISVHDTTAHEYWQKSSNCREINSQIRTDSTDNITVTDNIKIPDDIITGTESTNATDTSNADYSITKTDDRETLDTKLTDNTLETKAKENDNVTVVKEINDNLKCGDTYLAVPADGKKVEVVEMDGTVHVQIVNPTDSAAAIEGAICLMNPRNKEQGKRRVELKAAIKVGLIVCCIVCLWLPLPISVCIFRGTSGWSESVKMNVLAVFTVLATSTAAVDPILYGLLNRQIRSALHAGLLKIRRKIFNYCTN